MANEYYKTFIISPWDSDKSELIQYATTWQICSDPQCNNVVIQSVEDTDNIYAWKVNVVIPKGETWYVRALRHFKDTNGNIIAYDTWIGPEPIMDNKTSVNELLLPDLHIEPPAILNYTITKDNITINLADPIGDVPDIKTIGCIYAKDEKTYTFETTNNQIVISYEDFDYITNDKFEVVLIHVGKFNIISPQTSIHLSYTDGLFTIKGNLLKMDPGKTNIVELDSIDDNNPITINYANIYDIDTLEITPCDVKNNKQIFIDPTKFDHTHYLNLEINITYKDPRTNELRQDDKYLPIKFISDSDIENTIETYDYQYLFESKGTINNVFIDSNMVIAEETNPGFIPVIKNNKINIITTTPENDNFVLVKNTNITLPDTPVYSNIQIMNINNNDYVVVTYSLSNNSKILIYNLDYVNILVGPLVKQYTVNNTQFVANNSIFYYKNKPCIAYKDSSNLVIYYIDITQDNLVLLETIPLPDKLNTLSEIVVNSLDVDKLMLYPVDKNASYNFIYTATYKKFDTGMSIPTDMRGIEVTGIRLMNGIMLYMPYNTNSTTYKYLMYDYNNNSFTENSVTLPDNACLTNTILFKNRTFDKMYIKDNTTILYYYH